MNDFPNKTWTVGRLVLTTCIQAGGNPVIDGCHTRSVDGWSAGGWAILPKHGPGRALVVAVKDRPGPSYGTVKRLRRLPIVGSLFRSRFGGAR